MQTMYDCACCGAPVLHSEVKDRHQIREGKTYWSEEMLSLHRRVQAAEAEINIMLKAKVHAQEECEDIIHALTLALEDIAFAAKQQHPADVREQRDDFNRIARTALQNIRKPINIEYVSR